MIYIYSGSYENTNSTSTSMLLSREIHLTKALGQHRAWPRQSLLRRPSHRGKNRAHRRPCRQDGRVLPTPHTQLRYTTMHSSYTSPKEGQTER